MRTETEFTETPGTVSKILWHFTGGPSWNKKEKKQNTLRKPAQDAYKNLKAIIRSRQLKRGNYREVVKVFLGNVTDYNWATEEEVIKRNVTVEIESSPICCLSDIPAPHLRYHASRYGKFAIGFHRDAVIKAGFNPVFYTLQNMPIVRSIYEGYSSIKSADLSVLQKAAETIEDEDHTSYNQWALYDIEGAIYDVQKSLKDFTAFIKTFDKSEFGTIYCEREWRSVRMFKFKLNDIAMIVLPKTTGGKNYFTEFVENIAPKLKLPRSIPIIPWDDLIEH